MTPTLSPQTQTLVLDIHSIVAQSDKPIEPIHFEPNVPMKDNTGKEGPVVQGVTRLDRVNVVTQQLATTVKLELGRPKLIGGFTIEPEQAKTSPAKAPSSCILSSR